MNQHQFHNNYDFNIRTDKLGGGAFGTVYKAYDRSKNKYVAIKVAEVKQMGNKTFSLEDDVNISNKIPRHENVAHYEKAFEYQMPNGIFGYAVMDYFPEGDLKNVMQKRNLSVTQKKNITVQILKGIIHLHKHKVVHRDLKPANILVEKQGDHYIPKIADFGLSKQTDNELNSRISNSFAGGTLAYCAPEQFLGQSIRFNTDLWAFGVIVYELFLGERPFRSKQSGGSYSSDEHYIQNEIIKAPIPRNVKNIPPPFRAIVKKCLVKKPEKRVKRGEDLMQLLKERYSDDQTKVDDGTTSEKKQNRRYRFDDMRNKVKRDFIQALEWRRTFGIPDFWFGFLSPLAIGLLFTLGATASWFIGGIEISCVDWLWELIFATIGVVILFALFFYNQKNNKLLKMNSIWYGEGVGVVLMLFSLVKELKPEVGAKVGFLDLGIPFISIATSSMFLLMLVSILGSTKS